VTDSNRSASDDVATAPAELDILVSTVLVGLIEDLLDEEDESAEGATTAGVAACFV